MTKALFNEFPEVSAKEWKQKIQVDLKGADYNETLVWKTNEGINVKPFYHKDTFENAPYIDSSDSQWRICQIIFVQNLEVSNSRALDAINRGAESIKFIIPEETLSVEKLLKNIDTSKVLLFFELHFLSSEFVNNLSDYCSKNSIYITTDIIGNLAKTGNWYQNLEDDHKQFDAIVSKTNCLSIDLALYQNAGANMVQQLAYALAHTNEYFNHGLKNEKSTLKVVFNVSIGSNYFFEIAKLQALRILLNALAKDYGITTDCHIFATPSKRNKTLYDYNINMLRTTTECMSAILGGVNTIYNSPYDVIYHKNNEFGDRIARNQLLVLKHESYFDKVKNPAEGAYYIETLTSELSEKALALLKEIETQGGFLKQLKVGTIQRKIKESAQKEQDQFDSGDLVLLGSNKHPNPKDRMSQELELYPFVKTNMRKTLIEPIIEKRLAEALEQNRLKTE